MTRKQGSRYRRNPVNVNISPIPKDLNDTTTDYLSTLQKSVGVGLKIKNEKGNEIPIRYKDGSIQVYENKNWKDLNKSETIVNNNTVTKTETVYRSSGSAEASINYNYKYIENLIKKYMKNNIVGGNFVNVTYDSQTNKYIITTTYSEGDNIHINEQGEISADTSSYDAGNGIDITNDVISAKIKTNETVLVSNSNGLSINQSNINYNNLSNKPTIPTVPTNVSAFVNDVPYLTSHQDISDKQDKLIAGANITIASDGRTISASGSGGTTNYNDLTNKPQINYTTLTGNKSLNDLGIASISSVNAISTMKQDRLTTGTGINITNNVISSTVVGIPSYSSADNGKVLKIVNGVPVWAEGGEEEMNATNWVVGDYDVGTTAWFVENGISKKNINYPDTSLYLEVTDGSQAGGYYINYNDVDYLYYFEDASMFSYEDMACHFPAPSGWISQPNDKIEIRFSFKLVSVNNIFQKQVEIKYRYFRSV